jgi:hypothetical protein
MSHISSLTSPARSQGALHPRAPMRERPHARSPVPLCHATHIISIFFCFEAEQGPLLIPYQLYSGLEERLLLCGRSECCFALRVPFWHVGAVLCTGRTTQAERCPGLLIGLFGRPVVAPFE